MPDPVDNILQDCLELIRQGASVVECLARYPEKAEELDPLLRTALSARGQLTPGMPSPARARVRASVLAEWDRRHLPKPRSWRLPVFLPRWAAVAASVVVVMVLSGTGTVLASTNSVPGDPLYAVKQLREDVQLWFTWSSEAKVDIYTRLVQQRAEELRKLASAGRAGSASIAVARLQSHVDDINQLAKANMESPTDGQSPASSRLLKKLQESVQAQQSAADIIQQMLDEAPAEVRAGLLGALEAIEEARNRVRAAQEAIAVPASP